MCSIIFFLTKLGAECKINRERYYWRICGYIMCVVVCFLTITGAECKIKCERNLWDFLPLFFSFFTIFKIINKNGGWRVAGGGWRVRFKRLLNKTIKKIVAALLLIIVHNCTISGKLVTGLLLKKKLRYTQWNITRHTPPMRIAPTKTH